VAIPVFVGRSSTACFVGRLSTACSCRPFVDSVLVVWRLHRLVLRFRLSVVGQPRGPFGHIHPFAGCCSLRVAYVYTCSRDLWRSIGWSHSFPVHSLSRLSFDRFLRCRLRRIVRCSWPCHGFTFIHSLLILVASSRVDRWHSPW